MPRPPKSPTSRLATTHDPLVQECALTDAETMALLNALSKGMGYRDGDGLSPDQEAAYRQAGETLLMWATAQRVANRLLDMAMDGEMVIRVVEGGVEFGPPPEPPKVN